MQAPLGLAVIGGLVMSTFATLLVLPSIFAVVIGQKVARSPSIYPDDPESVHYDPLVYADHGPSGHDVAPWPRVPRPRSRHPDDLATVRVPSRYNEPGAPASRWANPAGL